MLLRAQTLRQFVVCVCDVNMPSWQEYQRFVSTKFRMPSPRSHTVEERELARWVQDQLSRSRPRAPQENVTNYYYESPLKWSRS
jgi:hypothetical protein